MDMPVSQVMQEKFSSDEEGWKKAISELWDEPSKIQKKFNFEEYIEPEFLVKILKKEKWFRVWNKKGAMQFEALVSEEGSVTMVLYNEEMKYRSNYKDGKLHGTSKSWYKNGKQAGISEFVNDKKHGTDESWYESGQKKCEAKWQNGILQMVSSYQPDGQKCQFTNFRQGAGKVFLYHENGKKMNELTYSKGKLNGNFKVWDENGEITQDEEYKDNEPVLD